MNHDELWKVIDRSKHLADLPIDVLRKIAAGFRCDEEPSQADRWKFCIGKTRGDLIEMILSEEFEP